METWKQCFVLCQVTMFARRRLEAGDEVTDCYGFHYTSLPCAERRARLERWFRFRCECCACAGGYPVMGQLGSALSQTSLDTLKTLLEKFQWALKNGQTKKSLDFSIKYLKKMASLNVPRPHKAWEAGSHALTCALWAVYKV